MALNRVEFTVSVPFPRFPRLKQVIENRQRWKSIDETWSYFECEWKPEQWLFQFRNLTRELQMQTFPRRYQTTSKRRNLWGFEMLSTIRRRLIHRAGRLIRPQRVLTLVLGGNERVRDELEAYLQN